MCTLLPIQQASYQYNFSIEKLSQSRDKIVLIEQSNQGLKLFVKDSHTHRLYPVEKHMIKGLPKLDFIPMEFFHQCYSIVKSSHTEAQEVFFGIDFKMRILGGARGGGGAKPGKSPGIKPSATNKNPTQKGPAGSKPAGSNSAGSNPAGKNGAGGIKPKKEPVKDWVYKPDKAPAMNNYGTGNYAIPSHTAKNAAMVDARIVGQPLKIKRHSDGTTTYLYQSHGNNQVELQHHPHGHPENGVNRAHWHVRPASDSRNGHPPSAIIKDHYFYGPPL